MGSSEIVSRNLELLRMQYGSQREWAEQAAETARDGVRHFSKLADSIRCDCEGAMKARASALSFERAAAIFGEVVSDCERILAEIEGEMAA